MNSDLGSVLLLVEAVTFTGCHLCPCVLWNSCYWLGYFTTYNQSKRRAFFWWIVVKRGVLGRNKTVLSVLQCILSLHSESHSVVPIVSAYLVLFHLCCHGCTQFYSTAWACRIGPLNQRVSFEKPSSLIHLHLDFAATLMGFPHV